MSYRNDTVRALHLLLGRVHLALAGVRELRTEEWDLLDDLDRWLRRRRRDQLSGFLS